MASLSWFGERFKIHQGQRWSDRKGIAITKEAADHHSVPQGNGLQTTIGRNQQCGDLLPLKSLRETTRNISS